MTDPADDALAEFKAFAERGKERGDDDYYFPFDWVLEAIAIAREARADAKFYKDSEAKCTAQLEISQARAERAEAEVARQRDELGTWRSPTKDYLKAIKERDAARQKAIDNKELYDRAEIMHQTAWKALVAERADYVRLIEECNTAKAELSSVKIREEKHLRRWSEQKAEAERLRGELANSERSLKSVQEMLNEFEDEYGEEFYKKHYPDKILAGTERPVETRLHIDDLHIDGKHIDPSKPCYEPAPVKPTAKCHSEHLPFWDGSVFGMVYTSTTYGKVWEVCKPTTKCPGIPSGPTHCIGCPQEDIILIGYHKCTNVQHCRNCPR